MHISLPAPKRRYTAPPDRCRTELVRYVDRGYRGHRLTAPRERPAIKRELRRRNAIEPVIGDIKSHGLLERKHLAGTGGDTINAVLAGAGHNVRLLLRWLRDLWLTLLSSILMPHPTMRDQQSTYANAEMRFGR